MNQVLLEHSICVRLKLRCEMKKHERPTDIRRLRKETDRKLLIMVLVMLVLVGGGLIAVIYSPTALLTALPCLLSGAGLILTLYLLLAGLERWLDKEE
jgi:protein-S-isoprenylcysteine O-methyltransferase Ste14